MGVFMSLITCSSASNQRIPDSARSSIRTLVLTEQILTKYRISIHIVCADKGDYFEILSVDVERHARDFMEAAKKLQVYFISLQREDQPTKAETLRKEIAVMEEELRLKTELINKQERLIQGWRKELKDQLDKHNTELERV
ncbi:Mediator of RNA polymerase II transcription subunit 28 [Vitis vinifera]|uniref:Mediator of RNA polymerase II transcription subunit 28 n=1 Tax=Vitis vinifera TaxID=29760 RepID=A0A438KGV4_VITVI|nr:Mediator of RNA polymerase II transcription subunit 28 [Vitis vinifera]